MDAKASGEVQKGVNAFRKDQRHREVTQGASESEDGNAVHMMGKRSQRTPQRRRPRAFGNFGCTGSSGTGGSPVDVSEMQKKLRQWATENPFDHYRDLSHLLCHDVWLRVAHHAVNANQGRETAGRDGRTMSNFNGDVEGNLQRLSAALKAKTFEPLPVRRVYIPKPNGKKRPLGIPMCPAYCLSFQGVWE